MDAQANCTSGLGHEKTANASLYPVLLGERKLEEQITKTECEGVSLIPSEFDLCAAEVELARLSFESTGTKTRKKADRHLTWLKDALTPVAKGSEYDVVLIDCPPSLGKLTLSVLIAADGLLIPLQCEYYPLEGISSITDLMDQLRSSGVNKNLELIGVLMTMFDSRRTYRGWSWAKCGSILAIKYFGQSSLEPHGWLKPQATANRSSITTRTVQVPPPTR